MSDARTRADVDAEATRWVVRMHSDQVTLEDERAFSAWLAENEENRAAYERLGALWAGVGRLREDPERVAALAALREGEPEQPDRRRLIAASLAGGLILAGGGSWLGWRALYGAETYETALGEQRRLSFADGTQVTLNTESRLRVRFDESERHIWLDRGQAFFQVARDPSRPFRVFVGDDEVRALGTAFEVRRDGNRARVTLEEGVVALYRNADRRPVADAPAVRAAAILRPGQQAVVDTAPRVRLAAVDTRRTAAWRFGRMDLESEPLAEAVAEINRYNARQIVLADPSLEAMPINGVFQTGRPEAFVEALTIGFPVEIRAEDDRTIQLVRRRQ